MPRNELLKTPDEFIEEESENLKKHLDNYDLQINKLGFVGFLMNLLGNMRYDATKYYQGLHRESFVALAEHNNNLYMHSSIYGYQVPFATPAQAEGTITFDFSLLPKSSSSRRFVTLSNIHFEYDGIPFQTDTRYRFIEEDNSYYAIVYHPDGTTSYVPAPTQKITVPFFNVRQYKTVKEKFTLPDYSHGTYYNHEIDLDEDYLSDIRVFVREYGKSYETQDGQKFDIKTVKYLEGQFSPVVFLRAVSPNEYIIAYGSGIRGLYVPNAKTTIYKDITKGSDGHISVKKTLRLEDKTRADMRVVEGDTESSRSISLRFFNVNFEYSDYGQRTPTDEKLKQDIVEHIQTRDFLIDRKDYYNLTPDERGDFVYSFRKSHIYRNDFYLHRVLRDPYQIPYLTNCLVVEKLNTENQIENLLLQQITETDGTLEGNWQYWVLATDGFHINQYTTDEIDLSSGNAVQLNWDEYEGAYYYIIVAYDGIEFKYYSTQNNYFIHYGQSSDFQNTFIDYFTSDLTPIFSWKNSYIFFPQFNIDGIQYCSPFVYKYNHNMNWFRGYVFYDSFIILFSSVTEQLRGHVVPNFQLNVSYNYEKRKTEFNIISTQSLEDYSILVTVSKTDINQKEPERLNENTFYVDYTDDHFGVLQKQVEVEIEIYYSTEGGGIIYNAGLLGRARTTEFYQMQSLEDQLKLLTYTSSENKDYVLAIPLIEKEPYLENRNEIDMRILDNMYGRNIEGRRFPNDEVQFRFINTDTIYSFYLRNSVIQHYDFDLKLPLKMEIDIIYNSNYIDDNPVNIPDEREKLYLELTKKLQSDYSGNEIKFYNSQIVDFIHSNRPFIKSVDVKIKDSNDVIIPDGIESYKEPQVMENLQDKVRELELDKIKILSYFPHFFYWDVDNIKINYSF